MRPLNGLRNWWQRHTGEEETPFDGDAPVWVISMLFHLVLMFILAFLVVGEAPKAKTVEFITPVEEVHDPLEIPEEFHFSEVRSEEIGANSVDGTEMAQSEAQVIAEVSVVPSPAEITETEIPDIEINPAFDVATGLQFANLPVKGHVGQGATGATGAIDRITHEILLNLEERKTLVVWLFDQSASLTRQREEIHDRFDRIYEELGVIEAAGNEAFAKHDKKPLLTSVVAFGSTATLLTKKPTDNITEIKEAIAGIQRDDTGKEFVFSAVTETANWFRDLRIIDPETREPERNVMIVVFSDEKGDDQEKLDDTIRVCRRYQMPVYVVGVPAPFGRDEVPVKWVDPDPEYDQSPQWPVVHQGPESFFPERIKLHFSGGKEESESIDSGFGPYALTRLTYETGGIYFAVHPNRNVNREVTRRETAAFSAHIEHFFDPNVMRRYRPDYVSVNEYKQRLNENKARLALIEAANQSWLTPMEQPRLRFERLDEAAFVNALSEAQKDAAKLGPKVGMILDKLALGEADREQETELRWQAGYDLAMGRALAVAVRTITYNSMLAEAKRGRKFEDEKNNTWVLTPDDEVSTGSKDAKMADKAKEYLQRVITDHPDTPWALLAKQELETPLSWKWTEEFTEPPAPRDPGMGNGNAPAPANDQRNMLKKPAPRRPPPQL